MHTALLYSETFEKPGDFHHPQKDDGFFEVTGGFRLVEPPARRGQNSPKDTLLKRPTREPRPPARRAYAP
ncbi:MAG: hypothetical protein ACQEQO_11930, partial [Thermodesulfobacteriota bacterium]